MKSFFLSRAGGSVKLQKIRCRAYELQETNEAKPGIGQGRQIWKNRRPRISKISILGGVKNYEDVL